MEVDGNLWFVTVCATLVAGWHWFAPVGRGRYVAFGVPVSLEYRLGPRAQTMLWVHRAVVAMCWGACIVLAAMGERRNPGLAFVGFSAVLLVPLVSWLVGADAAHRARQTGEAMPREPGRNRAPRRLVAQPAPTVATSDAPSRWRLVSSVWEPVLWAFWCGLALAAIRNEGMLVTPESAALILATMAAQVVGVWAAFASGSIAVEEPGVSGDIRGMSETYLRGWISTVYWMRFGTMVMAGGVLWTHLLERERLDQGMLPIGMLVALAWTLPLAVGFLWRFLTDAVDRTGMRERLEMEPLGMGDEHRVGGAYASQRDPRVWVKDCTGFGAVPNLAHPVAWAWFAVGLCMVVVEVVGVQVCGLMK